MNEDRRSFLKKAGRTALGVGCGLPLLTATGCNSDHASAADLYPDQWAMIIDVDLCGDEVCTACSNACNSAHNVPFIPNPDDDTQSDPKQGIEWIWPENYEDAFPDQVHAQAKKSLEENPVPVLVLCNHCTSPSCVRVCPTKATWKRESDGIVMMDMHRCIGCRYCMAACPYGARSFNWRNPRERDKKTGELLYFEDNELPSKTFPARTQGVVEKCNFCAERIRVGEQPACVVEAEKIEPGALTFGQLKDERIQEKLNEKRTIARRIGMGTGPNVFYVV